MRRFAAALALGTCLIAFAVPAAAGVRAFRTSDGSEDPAFVKLGARTRVDHVVSDGSQGVYLLGHIIVDGGARQIVHLRANGGVDRLFRPRIRGGLLQGAAVHGEQLALIGTFASIDGHARTRVAVVDARTGRPLPWKPQLPISASLYGLGQVLFAGRTLVVSTDGGLFAWRPRTARASWARDFQFTLIAPWRGAIWAVVDTPAQGRVLMSIARSSGRARVVARNFERVTGLQAIDGHLVALSEGDYYVYRPGAGVHVGLCGRAGGGIVAAVAGDARALYVGDDPSSLDVPGRVPGVTACLWSGGAGHFQPPALAYSAHGPIVSGLALVGTHVLVFTRRF